MICKSCHLVESNMVQFFMFLSGWTVMIYYLINAKWSQNFMPQIFKTNLESKTLIFVK